MSSLVLASALALGQDLEKVQEGAAADLKQAIQELSAARQEVESERLPMAKRLAELEQRLVERRAELSKAQRLQENQLVELNALKVEAKRQSDAVKFIESLLGEYSKAFRSRLSFVEEPRYASALASFDKAAASPDLSPADRFQQRSSLLVTGLQRSEGALGGEILEGKALDKQGRVLPGKVALLGPVAVFASNAGDEAGVLQQELNKTDPTVVKADEKVKEACRTLAMSGAGDLVLDPTLGNAFKLAALEESLYEKLAKGGLIMVPLLGIGLGALLVGIFKWIQLSRIQLATEADLQKVLGHLEKDEPAQALQHARTIPGLAGNLLATAVDHADEKKEYIEEILYEKLLGARAKLERGIAFLALTATTGPLMGLLGTVMGMITTFKVISSFGSGDPKTLAAGISEALICTATGMAVAIPSLLLHAFLSRKARAVIGSMEQTSVGFINGVPQKDKDILAGLA